MPRAVSKEEIASAAQVNVYQYAKAMLADAFTKEGKYLRLKADHKITISPDKPGYFDNGAGRPGDGIDLLQRYFGCTFQDAVRALNDFSGVTIQEDTRPVVGKPKGIDLPAPSTGRYNRLYAYLMSRGIPANAITYLVKQGLLYQEGERNNAVFVSHDRQYAEIRGTYTFGEKAFHQSQKAQSNLFWCFPSLEASETVFVCEAAIDAISLAILRKKAGLPRAVYASIGGVANNGSIENLCSTGKTIILAVDNDEAGQECRSRFPGLKYTIPVNKDWNDDLLKGVSYNGQ